jgi:predicted lipid-binding transport protein (Tim44 family)
MELYLACSANIKRVYKWKITNHLPLSAAADLAAKGEQIPTPAAAAAAAVEAAAAVVQAAADHHCRFLDPLTQLKVVLYI